jgi:CHAT domain-containing protein
VVTSAYFVQMYRHLDQGVPKAEAMQLTRQAFIRNLVRLDGDRVMGVNDQPLLLNLTPSQQRRISSGANNPFFWGGIELMGSPW